MMSFELTCVAWTLVLAIVQIALAAVIRTAQYGPKWNMGARDVAQAPMKPLAGRLSRAQDNLFETLPLFVAAILIATVANKTGSQTHTGAMLYLVGRIVYLPLYAAGIPYLRTVIWTISFVGLVMCVTPLLGA
jgi:uncharacterized MAPEG superfamily protein